MELGCFSRQGKFEEFGETLNEDCVFACEEFGFVIDGATGLNKENVTDCTSDARWFAKKFRKFLMQELVNCNKSIQEIMRDGILKINEEYDAFAGAGQVESRPSCAIAIYRVKGDSVEFFTLGDCGFLVSYKSGDVELIKREDLTRLDEMNIKRLVAKAEQMGISVVNTRQFMSSELLEVRRMQNTANGYWILSNSLDAVDNATYLVKDKNEIKQIIGFSDGFSQLFDLFKIYTMEEFVGLVDGGVSFETLYSTLYDAQEKDADCTNYPRFKLRDDATILRYKF